MKLLRLRTIALLSTLSLALVPAASQAYQTGIGDQQPSMFEQPLYQALHVHIGRFIAPYDTADSPTDLQIAKDWMARAEQLHVQPLVAFYHSRVSPTRMPSVAKYKLEIKKFMKLFPKIKVYSAWNEANRGNVPGLFKSPSASQSAQYYLALRGACKRCTIVGLDVLDSQKISSTIRYIKDFQSHVRGRSPRIWGLHNYSDTNRNHSTGTKAVLAAVKGQVWLTETGGIVKFGGSFPENTTRAAKAIKYMFKLAKSNRRLTRLYIFNWTGGDLSERFDAGLTNPDGSARPGYFVVRKQLTGT
ncbi:MAG: hypothetical protein NVSMB51_16560 [Solirubrobacteraceae bacterium]